jgi:PAS domain S-box-containing protein
MTAVATGAIPRYLLSIYCCESQEPIGSVPKTPNPAENREAEMMRELDKVLVSSNWLREMLVAVEHIPICVTVAAASMAMPGFPLLYVNSAFESTTGYTRQEIIGQNCRFLQLGRLDGEVAEQESITRLSRSLSEAKQVRVAITNYRKDGTAFSNLLAMKPIMDEVSSVLFCSVPFRSVPLSLTSRHAMSMTMTI